VMAEAWIRRGSPFDTGYANDHGYRNVLPYSGRPGFSYPFLFGALSILFSFGRGLVFFMPGLLFWLDSRTRFRFEGRTRSIVVAMLVFTVGLVVVYAKWWAWYGGTATGPRFFLLASVPASILLADRLRQLGRGAVAGALTLAVLVLSTWVAVIGVLAGPAPPEVCTRDRFAHEPLCLYTPELSPLGHPLVSFPHLAPRTSLVALLCVGASAYLAAPVVEQVFSRLRALQPRDLLKGWSV
jgi:hypothetical protein